MLLGGLWHGAAWNFVIWGGGHGLLLALHRLTGGRRDPERRIAGSDWIRIALLFNAVSALWVFFRAETTADAWHFIGGLVGAGTEVGWPVLQTAVVLLCAGLHVAERTIRTHLPQIQSALARPWWGAAVEGAAFGVVVGLAIAVSGAGGEFIYFQF